MGNINKSAEVLSIEQGIYAHLPAAKNVSKVDIMELYGHADISFLAHQHHLKAMEPFDLLYGKDMNSRKDRQSWREAQEKHRPLLVIVETECTDWIIFNEKGLNYKIAWRSCTRGEKAQLPLVREGIRACYNQIMQNNLFLFENPAPSRIWELPELQELATRDDVYLVQCHSGACGGCNSRGEPIRKLYQWLTNSSEVATALSGKMTPEELGNCVPLIGKEVRRSARYSQKLCRASSGA